MTAASQIIVATDLTCAGQLAMLETIEIAKIVRAKIVPYHVSQDAQEHGFMLPCAVLTVAS